jgi:alcohol dehydrogenase class IV
MFCNELFVISSIIRLRVVQCSYIKIRTLQNPVLQPFTFFSPTRIVYGEDIASAVQEFISELGGKKTLIITDANLIKAGILQPIIDSLKSGGNTPTIFDDVPSDSDVNCVNKAAEVARAANCDSVLAVGGGSVMDTAKVANICLSVGGDMMDHQGINMLNSKLLPMVAIPTTAGTGSEVSLVAMIKDQAEHRKLMFGSKFIAPDVALLDPNMVRTLPPKLTAATGLDALTHDIESLVAMASTSPFSDSLAIESMRLLFEYLPRATKDGGDMEARGATLIASTMAGVAFTNTGVGIVHALAHAIGAKYGTHHGMTNAVFLPYGIEFNSSTSAERYASVARILGISKASDDLGATRELKEAVISLTAQCGLPLRLSDLGVPPFSENDLEELAAMAMTDPAIMFNPTESSEEDMIGIYKRAY